MLTSGCKGIAQETSEKHAALNVIWRPGLCFIFPTSKASANKHGSQISNPKVKSKMRKQVGRPLREANIHAREPTSFS